MHALNTNDKADFDISTLHKCWFRIGKRLHNSDVAKDQITKYGPKICGCSQDNELVKYKILKETIKYEKYIPFKIGLAYSKGDKVFVDDNELEDFEKAGTDHYFTAKRNVKAHESVMIPTTADEDKWELTSHRYLGIYINFLENNSSSRLRVEKKLAKAFYIIANKRFTIFETYLNITGVIQTIFGYTTAVTPFASHILKAWDKDMELALARKVGIRVDIMKWSQLVHASFDWGGFEIPSFLTLQTVVMYRLYNRTQIRPDRHASFALKVLYSSLMEEVNTWGKYSSAAVIPLAILIEISKEQHANPLAIYIIGLRKHGFNLYERSQPFTRKDQKEQESSSIWAFQKEYFWEAVARENMFRERIENEWNKQFKFSPKQRQSFVERELKKKWEKTLKLPEVQKQLLVNRKGRTRKMEDKVEQDIEVEMENNYCDHNHITQAIRVGTDASLRHMEFGTVIKIAVVVDARPDDTEKYRAPELTIMESAGYKMFENYTTPKEIREEIMRKEDDIFKYGFPPPRNIWVKTQQFLCTTTWNIGMGEQIGINMACKLPYNIALWGDNLNTINDSNSIIGIVQAELEDEQNYILDEDMKEVLQEVETLQNYKVIIRWRRENKLTETLAHCRSHGNGWDDDPEKRQSKEVTFLNHYADLMCDTNELLQHDVKCIAPRNVSTNWLYVGIQGEEIKEPAKSMIKVQQLQSDLKIKAYGRVTATAFMKKQLAGIKITHIKIHKMDQHLQNFLHRLKAYSLPTRTRNHNYGKRGDRRNGAHYKCLASGCKHNYANQDHFMFGECRSTHEELQVWPVRVCNKIIELAPRGWPFMGLKGPDGGWDQHNVEEVWKHLMQIKTGGGTYEDTYDIENYGFLDKESLKWTNLQLHSNNINNNTIAWIKSGTYLYRISKIGTMTVQNPIYLTPDEDQRQNDGIISIIKYCTNLADKVIFVNPKHKLNIDNIHNWIVGDPRFHLLKEFKNWNWISIYDNLEDNFILSTYNDIIEGENDIYITELNKKNILRFKAALRVLHGPKRNGQTRREFLQELEIADPFQALNFGGIYEGQAKECRQYSHYSLHYMVMCLFTLERWGQDMEVEEHIKYTSIYTRKNINFGNEFAELWIYTYKNMFRDYANQSMTHPDRIESKQLKLDKAERDKAARLANTAQRHAVTCQLGGCDKAVTGKRSNYYCTKHFSISFVKNNYQLMYTETSVNTYGNIHSLLREYYIIIGRCQHNKSLGEQYRCPAPIGMRQCYCKLHAVTRYNVRCQGIECREPANESGNCKGFCSNACKTSKAETVEGRNTRSNTAKVKKSVQRRTQRLQNKLTQIKKRKEYRDEHDMDNRDPNLHIMVKHKYTNTALNVTRCLGGDGGINIIYTDMLSNIEEVTVSEDGNSLFNSMEMARYGKIRREYRKRDARTRLYSWLQWNSNNKIQGITLRDWIKSATNDQMEVTTYCKQRIANNQIRGGGIEIAMYAIQFEAIITIWNKVNDHNGQRKAYQRISFFLPPGRVKYKLHLLWVKRNHYSALLNIPHDA